MRFDGNSILIADPDTAYGMQLSDALTLHGARCSVAEHLSAAKALLLKYDFDMVISNYYLSDGIIHQLIDWSTSNLSSVPIFTCVNYPFPADANISKNHSIAQVFTKGDSRKILSTLSDLLFDFSSYKESLHEISRPVEILIELHVSGKCHIIRPQEITHDSVFLQLDSASPKGDFGILKFSLLLEGKSQNFLIPGQLMGAYPGGQLFKINQKYLKNWEKFLNYLNLKQLRITNFLNKASGL